MLFRICLSSFKRYYHLASLLLLAVTQGSEYMSSASDQLLHSEDMRKPPANIRALLLFVTIYVTIYNWSE